jgi:Fe-S cluster biosynthesis and repair protein YggX|tara:strand:- start:1665 stop:1904 length:240 start_codon:yes stop_codon:yes gene_type:complete
MINCVKCKMSKDPIESTIFKGEFFEKMEKSVCNECFLEWENDMQMKVMNEFRLDLSKKEHRDFMFKKMMEFLNLEQEEL